MIKQLKSLLERSEDELLDLEKENKVEDKYTHLFAIQNNIFQILDYIATGFPDSSMKHFPRKQLENGEETLSHFLTRIERDKKYLVKKNSKPYFFIRRIYRKIIPKYNNSILYLVSRSKHDYKARPDITDRKTTLDYSVSSNIPENPIRSDNNGVSIGDHWRIARGANVKLKNVNVIEGDRITKIDQFNYKSYEVVGEDVTFSNEEKRNLADWLKDCLSTCKEIIDLFNREN